MAGDAVSVAPNLYKVLLENDKVRVLETRYGPGVKSEMHFHPDLVAVALTPAKAILTLAEGRIRERLGQQLQEYNNLQPGSLTFLWYNLGKGDSFHFPLLQEGRFSTLVNQVALAFTSPTDLPPAGAYEAAIRHELELL